MNEETPKPTTRITILDEPFAIRSDEDAEYTRKVAAHVDRTLRDLRRASPGLEPFPVAVLGAMEITDRLLRSRERLGTAIDEMVYEIERLESRVDQALEKADTPDREGAER